MTPTRHLHDDAEEPRRDLRQLYTSDEPIRELLRSDEHVLQPRRVASISVVHNDGERSPSRSGVLYLTNMRLIHLNARTSSIELSEIRELGIARHRLLVSLFDATGVIFDLDHPADFRTRVAAAMSAARSR